MAEWNKNKVSPSAINGGQEFTNGDNLAVNELNAIVNNSFYASKISENAMQTSEETLAKINEFVEEKGKTAVTINGEVQSTWSADFAEAERQKSKNLFKVNNEKGYSVTRNGVTATVNDDYTITLNGTNTGNTYWNILNGISSGVNVANPLILNSNKTYSFVLKHVSGSYTGTPETDTQVFGAIFRKTDGGTVVDNINIGLAIRTNNNNDLNITRSGIDAINDSYFRTSKGVTYNNYTIGLMICEGSDTSFESWNGAIVHEEDIEDIKTGVEQKELFYDVRNNKINIEFSTLTTLREFFDLFGVDDNKIYVCQIGNSSNNNFKNLLPSVDMGGYSICYIKLYANDFWGDLRLKTYEIIALNQINKQIAKGYLYCNVNNNVVFTGWTKIGQTESSGGGISLHTQEFTTLTQAFTFIDSQSISYDNILELEVTIGTPQSGTMQIAKIESSGASFSTSSSYRAIYAGTYSFKHSKPENAFTYYGSSGVSSPMIFYELIPYSGNTLFKMKAKLESLSSTALIFYSTTEDIIVESDSASGNITKVKVVYIK